MPKIAQAWTQRILRKKFTSRCFLVAFLLGMTYLVVAQRERRHRPPFAPYTYWCTSCSFKGTSSHLNAARRVGENHHDQNGHVVEIRPVFA